MRNQCATLYSARDPRDTLWHACILLRGHDGPHRTVDGATWQSGDEHHVSDREFWDTMLKNGREHPELIEPVCSEGSGS